MPLRMMPITMPVVMPMVMPMALLMMIRLNSYLANSMKKRKVDSSYNSLGY